MTEDRNKIKYDFEKRTAEFGGNVIIFCKKIRQNTITKPLNSKLIIQNSHKVEKDIAIKAENVSFEVKKKGVFRDHRAKWQWIIKVEFFYAIKRI